MTLPSSHKCSYLLVSGPTFLVWVPTPGASPVTLLWKVSSLSCNPQCSPSHCYSINSCCLFSHSRLHIILQRLLHLWVPFLSKFLEITVVLGGSCVTLSLCNPPYRASGALVQGHCSCQGQRDGPANSSPGLSLWQWTTSCGRKQLLLDTSSWFFSHHT